MHAPGYLTLIAYWSASDDVDAPAEACRPLKVVGTELVAVNFRPDNPELPAILRDLRAFELDELSTMQTVLEGTS